MLSKRSFSTTAIHAFSWPGKRPRKKQQGKNHTTPVTEETKIPSAIEQHKFSWPGKMHKTKNKAKGHTTRSEHVQSSSYPTEKTASGEIVSTSTVEEYSGIGWKKFNWNSEHTSKHPQKKKHTTQHGTKKTSSTRKSKAEFDMDQESSDYELTQSEVDYQTEDIANKEYPDYYSSETDTGNIEPNQDLNENPTATEMYHSISQSDMMNIEPTYQESEEATSPEFLDNTFNQSEVFDGVSENPDSTGEGFLTFEDNEEATQEMSGIEMNQDTATVSDENVENLMEQEPKNELTGLDTQEKKKLFDLADELLKDFSSSTVTEEKSTEIFGRETPKKAEETTIASPARNDYESSQNPDEGPRMQFGGTEEPSNEGRSKSSEKAEVTKPGYTEIMKKVFSHYMTQIIPETVSEVWHYNWGQGFNATEENEIVGAENPESPLKFPEEEEEASTELEEVTFTSKDFTVVENENKKSSSVSEKNDEVEFGVLERSTVIYNENEEELSSPRVGEEFDISEQLETELPQSEPNVKNTGVFSALSERTASTKPSSSQKSTAAGENNATEMNGFSSTKSLLTTRTSSAKYLSMGTKALEPEDRESNTEVKPKTDKMGEHIKEPIVSTTSVAGPTENTQETEERSVTSSKLINIVGTSEEEVASRSTSTKYVEVIDYDENDTGFASISASPEYQESESEIGTSEGISTRPSTVKHVKSTITAKEISEETTKELVSHTHRQFGSSELTAIGNIITILSQSSKSPETGETETSKQPSPQTSKYQKSTKETKEGSSFTKLQPQKTKPSQKATEMESSTKVSEPNESSTSLSVSTKATSTSASVTSNESLPSTVSSEETQFLSTEESKESVKVTESGTTTVHEVGNETEESQIVAQLTTELEATNLSEKTTEKKTKLSTETSTQTKPTAEISSTLVLEVLETTVGKESKLSTERSTYEVKPTSEVSSTLLVERLKTTREKEITLLTETTTYKSTQVLEGLETTVGKENKLSTETPTHEKKATSEISSTLVLKGLETTSTHGTKSTSEITSTPVLETTIEQEINLSTETSTETKLTSKISSTQVPEGLATTIEKESKLSTETKSTAEISSTLILEWLQTTVGKVSKLSTETPTHETKATSEVSSTLVLEGFETTVEKESESSTKTSTHGTKSTSEITSNLVLEGLETTIEKESNLSTETKFTSKISSTQVPEGLETTIEKESKLSTETSTETKSIAEISSTLILEGLQTTVGKESKLSTETPTHETKATSEVSSTLVLEGLETTVEKESESSTETSTHGTKSTSEVTSTLVMEGLKTTSTHGMKSTSEITNTLVLEGLETTIEKESNLSTETLAETKFTSKISSTEEPEGLETTIEKERKLSTETSTETKSPAEISSTLILEGLQTTVGKESKLPTETSTHGTKSTSEVTSTLVLKWLETIVEKESESSTETSTHGTKSTSEVTSTLVLEGLRTTSTHGTKSTSEKTSILVLEGLETTIEKESKLPTETPTHETKATSEVSSDLILEWLETTVEKESESSTETSTHGTKSTSEVTSTLVLEGLQTTKEKESKLSTETSTETKSTAEISSTLILEGLETTIGKESKLSTETSTHETKATTEVSSTLVLEGLETTAEKESESSTETSTETKFTTEISNTLVLKELETSVEKEIDLSTEISTETKSISEISSTLVLEGLETTIEKETKLSTETSAETKPTAGISTNLVLKVLETTVGKESKLSTERSTYEAKSTSELSSTLLVEVFKTTIEEENKLSTESHETISTSEVTSSLVLERLETTVGKESKLSTETSTHGTESTSEVTSTMEFEELEETIVEESKLSTETSTHETKATTEVSSTLVLEGLETTAEKESESSTETSTETKFTTEISNTLVLKELETSVEKEIELSTEISTETKSISEISGTLVLEGLETTIEKETKLSTETSAETKPTAGISTNLVLKVLETTVGKESKLSTERSTYEAKSTSELSSTLLVEVFKTTIEEENKLSTDSHETISTSEVTSSLVLERLKTTVGKESKLSTETSTHGTESTSEVTSTMEFEELEETIVEESKLSTETSTHETKATSELSSTLELERLETTLEKESESSTKTSTYGTNSTSEGSSTLVSWLASAIPTELAEEILPNTPKVFQIPTVIKVNASKIYTPPYEMSFQTSATTLELAESTQQSLEAENETILVQTTEKFPILSSVETEISERIPITNTEISTGTEMSSHLFPEQSEIVEASTETSEETHEESSINEALFSIFPSLAATSPSTTGLEVETSELMYVPTIGVFSFPKTTLIQSLEEKSEETLSQVRLSSEKGYQNPTEIGIISKITNEPHEVSAIIPLASEAETTPLFEFTVRNEINLLSTGVGSVTSSISIESPLEIPTLEEIEKIEVTSGQEVESLTISATLSAESVEAESQLPVTIYMGTQLPGEIETTFINNVWTVSENLPAWTTGFHMLEEVKPTTNVKSHETSTFVSSIHTPEIETTLLFQPNKYEETEVVSQTDQSIPPIEEVESISILGISPTETSVVNESEPALTNEMGYQISEETTATTETKNVTSHEILTSTQAHEGNETILFPHLKEYTKYTEMSPQSENHLSSITEMNIRPSEEVEATSETVSVSTENTQGIAIQMPEEFKETPKIPYIPFHETPSSVRTAVTEENGWSPSEESSPESVISETEIFTQQTPKEMSEESGIHMISTTESNIQILTGTSKFEQEQNISVSTETPPLAVSENEELFTNVSTWESTEISQKAEEISTEVNVASNEPTEVVEVTEMKIHAMNESSSQIEEIDQSTEITTESPIVSKIPSLMQTITEQLSTEMSAGTDIHMVSTTESNLQIPTETSKFEIKIATELTYLPSHEISKYPSILNDKEKSTEASEATIYGATLNGISTSETIEFSEGIEKTSAKSETNVNGEYEQPTEIFEQKISTYENTFPSSNISTQPTSESSGVINQGTMETYETNVTYEVTPEIIMASSTQSEASTSSQESEELLKPLGESFTSEKIPERTPNVIIPSVQATETTSVIPKEKPSSFETTAFQEPKEEELETFAFTRVLEESTLCETCSEESKPGYTTPSTTELGRNVESTVESGANIVKISTPNSGETAQTDATAELIGLSELSTKLGHFPQSAETLELEAGSSVIHEGVTEASLSTIGKSDETETASYLGKSERTSGSGHFPEEGAELEDETTVEHEEEYNEESESITEEITSYSGESSELGNSSEKSGESSKLEMESTIKHEGEVHKTSELTIEESTETSETEVEQEGKVTEASISEKPQEISEQNPSTEESTRASELEETTIKHKENVTNVSKTVINESTEMETEKSEKTYAETTQLEVEVEESTETSELEMESTMKHEGEESEAPKSTIEESTENSGSEVEQEEKVTEVSTSVVEGSIEIETTPSSEKSEESSIEGSAETVELEVESTNEEEITEESESILAKIAETETTSHSEGISEFAYSSEENAETSELEMGSTMRHVGEISGASESTIEESTETSETEIEQEGKVTETSASEKPQEISEQNSSTEEGTRASDLEETTIKHKENVTNTEMETEESEKSYVEEGTETTQLKVESTVKQKEEVTEASESTIGKSAETGETSHSGGTSELRHSSEESTETSELEMESTMKHEGEESEAPKSTIEESTETSGTEVEQEEKVTEASASEKPQEKWDQSSATKEGNRVTDIEEETLIKHVNNVTEVSKSVIEESTGIETTPSSEKSEESSIEGSVETVELEVESTNAEEITEESESILAKIAETETTSHSAGISELGYSSEESVETSELEMESTMRHEGEVSEASESAIEEITETSETEVEQEGKVTEASASEKPQEISEQNSSTEEGTRASDLEETTIKHEKNVTEVSKTVIEESTEIETTVSSEEPEETSIEGGAEAGELKVESTITNEEELTEQSDSIILKNDETKTYMSSKMTESSKNPEDSTICQECSNVTEKSARNHKGGTTHEVNSEHPTNEKEERETPVEMTIKATTQTTQTETILLETEVIVETTEESLEHTKQTETSLLLTSLEEGTVSNISTQAVSSQHSTKKEEGTHEIASSSETETETTAEITIQATTQTESIPLKTEVIVATTAESLEHTKQTEASILLSSLEVGTELSHSSEESAETSELETESITRHEGELSEASEEFATGNTDVIETEKAVEASGSSTEEGFESSEIQKGSTTKQNEVTVELGYSIETEYESSKTEVESTVGHEEGTKASESIQTTTLSSKPDYSITTDEEKRKTEQSGTTSPLTVKFDLKNVSHPSTMSSKITESTEEVAEGQLFHFSKTPEESTICEECSNVTEKSTVEHTEQTESISRLSRTGKHKHTTKAKTKPQDFLQTLTELSGAHFTSTTEKVSPAESSEDIEVLTELGVQDEKFVLKTAIENVTEEFHPMKTFETAIHGASTRKPHRGSGPPKTVVFIVNNSGKKIKKVNETVLQVLLNRSISDVNLEYIDLYNISKEPDRTNKSEEPEIAEPLIMIADGKVCHRSEFESNHACVCDVDAYLKSIEPNLGDNLKVDIKHYNCSHLVSFHDGLTISNAIKPVERRKRSLMYLSNKDRSGNVIENNDIVDVFNGDYELQTSDLNILALPGSKAILYCHNKADALLGNKGVAYSWEFNGDASKNGEILSTIENPLIIRNVEIKNEGNYTCTKTEEGGKRESYDHELEVVTLPIYKIQTTTFYSVNDTCSLSDGDLLYSYLPKIIGPILCGGSGKLCTVDVARPRCFTKNDDNFFNVTVTATMKDIGSILTGLDESKCSSTNCKLKVYTNMVGLVNKNSEIVKKLPVFSRIGPHLEFLTNVSFSGGKVVTSKPPKIITTCAGGYGIEKFKQRICVVCPKQTFSGDDEAFCKICPAGQYQPQAGSKVCLPCSSPVDDSMCLRMLYTDTKLFKIYVGVAFGLVLLIIFIMIFWNSNSRRYPKRQFEGSLRHHRAMRRRIIADVEKQDREPLLNKDNENRRKSPPEVPPPDF